MRKKILKAMTNFGTGTWLTYALFRGNPSELSREIETALSGMEIRYNRLVDPDCYSLRAYVTEHFGEGILLIEIRGAEGKVFYIVPNLSRVEFKNLRPEFELRFMVTKRAGLEALTDYICRGRITKRHAYRSAASFVVSMLAGFLSSALGGSFGPFAQFVVGLLVLFTVLFLLEYPLSVLSLKGVKTVEEKRKVKILVVRKSGDLPNGGTKLK
ncbi:hypothetical protein [Thermococcus sp. AM4]|uniref:hypothetical protein n=1 Tax=Thermococcus sp. (strain AM4) TaxID=246969 RepID=UPI0001870F79|nr:hypothetical protein [Thermococcus sp. AM4]EEB73161.1 hypothetical protein TAM4_2018 [Thermococcus sp. AM4]